MHKCTHVYCKELYVYTTLYTCICSAATSSILLCKCVDIHAHCLGIPHAVHISINNHMDGEYTIERKDVDQRKKPYNHKHMEHVY